MTYCVLKELKVSSDQSLIVVACLSKDMTSKTDLFRGNAIRVLARIMDSVMLSQMERFLKQSVVDKNPFIVSSTLVAGCHLWKSPGSSEVIKRWVTEVQEALNSKSRMVQYHSLQLLHRIKQNDKLAISKIVTALAKTPSRGAMAQVLQIRIISQLMPSFAPGTPQFTELLKYLVDCLHNANSMVMFESARAVSRLEMLTAMQVAPAVVGTMRCAAARRGNALH
jgi:coatomer subunit gamma